MDTEVEVEAVGRWAMLAVQAIPDQTLTPLLITLLV
jgi:hypothetical protein